jgi:hypothetical protein
MNILGSCGGSNLFYQMIKINKKDLNKQSQERSVQGTQMVTGRQSQESP